MEPEEGDTVRCVATTLKAWAGWKQRVAFAPQMKNLSGVSVDVSLKTDAEHGTVTITDAGSGKFDYVPDEGFYGTDAFEVTVNDGTDAVDYVITVTVEQRTAPQNQAAYPLNTEFSTDQGKPLLQARLQPYDPDGDYSSYDAVDYLLKKGWELAPNLTSAGTWTGSVAGPTTGTWKIQYNVPQDDKDWHFFDELYQWSSPYSFSRYTGGKDVVFGTLLDSVQPRNLSYRIQAQEDGSALSWFQLSSYKNVQDNSEDPVGSMVFTVPADGTYLFRGNEDCPDVGIPLIGITEADVNFSIYFWMEVNGVRETIKYVFNSSLLSIKFPEIVLDLKTGDEVRFVVTPGNLGGWKQRAMLAPVGVNLLTGSTTVTLKKGPPTEALQLPMRFPAPSIIRQKSIQRKTPLRCQSTTERKSRIMSLR